MDSLSTQERDRPVEITPAMIDAGLEAYFEFEGEVVGVAKAVEEIYIAMEHAA